MEAARLLIQAVQDHIHKVDPEAPPNISCKIRVFANIEGLTEAYRNNNILSVEESLTSFIQGFNQENALCDFVDAGNGKECADVKLRGQSLSPRSIYQPNRPQSSACFEQDIIDVHCRRIIFCASADNGHACVHSCCQRCMNRKDETGYTVSCASASPYFPWTCIAREYPPVGLCCLNILAALVCLLHLLERSRPLMMFASEELPSLLPRS